MGRHLFVTSPCVAVLNAESPATKLFKLHRGVRFVCLASAPMIGWFDQAYMIEPNFSVVRELTNRKAIECSGKPALA